MLIEKKTEACDRIFDPMALTHSSIRRQFNFFNFALLCFVCVCLYFIDLRVVSHRKKNARCCKLIEKCVQSLLKCVELQLLPTNSLRCLLSIIWYNWAQQYTLIAKPTKMTTKQIKCIDIVTNYTNKPHRQKKRQGTTFCRHETIWVRIRKKVHLNS